MAVGRAPESGEDLCSQPTMCRLENLPGAVALKRMMAAMVELFCDSFAQVPQRIVLDIDDVAIARVAQRAETDFIGAPIGIMDQMASSAGTNSSATVQQRQPLASSTMFSSGQAESPQPLSISPSMPTSPI